MTIANGDDQIAKLREHIQPVQVETRLNVKRSETKIETIEITHKDGTNHHILITTITDFEQLDIGTKVFEERKISVEATYLFGKRSDLVGEHIETMGGSYASHNGHVKLTNGGVMLKHNLRGMHLGSYMFNKVVEWAMQLDKNVPILPITLALVDATPDNKERRNTFYERFGLAFDYRSEEGIEKAAGQSRKNLTVANLISRPSLEGVERSFRLEGIRKLAHQPTHLRHEIDRLRRVANFAKLKLRRMDFNLNTAAKYLNWVIFIIIAVVAFQLGHFWR